MQARLRFLGAAQNVTGSRYCLEVNDLRLLVDCGLYQEREYRSRNWDPFPVPPETVDAVLLTHAHLDHCGLLPRLVHDGFRGPIYCTAATSDIAEIMLRDAARLQEEDAAFKKRRHEREGRKGPFPEVPLYTLEDAEASLPLFSPVGYKRPVRVGDGVEVTFHDAGHVFGSSMITVEVAQGTERRRILFSGDVGRWEKPILRNPTFFDAADYVVVESTYGDRLHEKHEEVGDRLAEVVDSTLRLGGNIVIPSFALERAQEVLYYLNELRTEGRIPRMLVFLDSPMAVSITDVFKRHPELYDEEMAELVDRNTSPFEFPGLKMIRTADESKAINSIRGTAIIIAGSGMCTGGRIKHHLVTNISRRESTVLFVGYQAQGTLGRHIVDGADRVRILGQHYRVRARIAQIHGFSAHADRDELFRWLSHIKKGPSHVFVTHGEPEAAESFRGFVRDKTGWDVSVPQYGAEVMLT